MKFLLTSEGSTFGQNFQSARKYEIDITLFNLGRSLVAKFSSKTRRLKLIIRKYANPIGRKN